MLEDGAAKLQCGSTTASLQNAYPSVLYKRALEGPHQLPNPHATLGHFLILLFNQPFQACQSSGTCSSQVRFNNIAFVLDTNI
jgi:hypothetical protein